MRIGIDIRNIGKKRTGDEVVFFNLAKNLAEIDNANEYHLFTDITDPTVLQYTVERLKIQSKSNFKLISLKCPNKFVWNFWTLPKYLRQNPVDIYLTQYITPWFVPKSVKIITVIHDISFNFYAKYIPFFDLFFLKLLIPLSLKRANKIIGVSKFTRDEIIKYYKINAEKADWIYNAVSDNFFEEIAANKLEATSKKYGLPKKFILYVGTLQPRKNLPALIEAFAKIKNEIPGTKLVLAGNRNGHNFDKKVDAAIKNHRLENDVLFPGFVDEEDKPAIFKQAAAFCFPSFYEGFGVPIAEAFISGVPAVISKIPPHAEIAGDAALFFDPNDREALSKSLLLACQDESIRNALIQKGHEQAQRFSWKNSAEKLLAICQKLEQ